MVIDNLQGGWCDSNKTHPRNEWAKKMAEEDPEEVKYHTDMCMSGKYIYRHYIEDLMKQYNQTGGRF